MNLAEIETFLTIVKTKSITRTADILFLSQPTVSHRLSSLEDELGFPLIIRNKGHKQVDLTPKGTEFILLAERWMSLWKETMELHRTEENLFLTIGCTDSLNISVFTPLYEQLLDQSPRIDLNIESHHSSRIYNLVGDHNIDIGFVYHMLHYKSILSEKIIEEKLYLVQSDHPAITATEVHTDQLDSSRELFLSWDDNYQIWHDKWFSEGHRFHTSADTITLLARLWKSPDNWLIAPESAVIEFSRYRPIYVSKLKNPPPNRVTYKLKSRFPKVTSEKAMEYFEAALDDFLKARKIEFPIGQVFGGKE